VVAHLPHAAPTVVHPLAHFMDAPGGCQSEWLLD
jgi:hypothetical protein